MRVRYSTRAFADREAIFKYIEQRSPKRSLLDIPLITGERLVFDGDAKEFSVE